MPDIRNGSISSIKEIVENLNKATLDPNVGKCSPNVPWR